jgi:hypothetical protein
VERCDIVVRVFVVTCVARVTSVSMKLWKEVAGKAQAHNMGSCAWPVVRLALRTHGLEGCGIWSIGFALY